MVSGQYEAVFDIYPVHLIKSIMVNDIDAMKLIYEVAPEDFALCEFVAPRKSCSIHRARRFGCFESGTRLIQSEQNARIRLR